MPTSESEHLLFLGHGSKSKEQDLVFPSGHLEFSCLCSLSITQAGRYPAHSESASGFQEEKSWKVRTVQRGSSDGKGNGVRKGEAGG